ncbi:MAG: LysR family transcriptional regulator [Enterococcus sp.]
MLFRQMHYFVSVVEKNSFTEAAEELFISQSAISQQIQALEEELGTDLLHRQHRKFTITPAGEYFYREAKRLLREIQIVKEQTHILGEDEELNLNIGYLAMYSGQELNQTIAQFYETYPEVSINIFNGTHEELYQELLQDTVDIVLSDQRRAFSPEYRNEEIARPKMAIELSARHPFSSQKKIDIQTLKSVPCILVANPTQQESEAEFYRNILGFNGTFLFAKSLEEGRMMVIGNRGFLPVEEVDTLPEPTVSVKRVALTKNNESLFRTFCAFWKKERSTYYIEEFVQLLRQQFHPKKEK